MFKNIVLSFLFIGTIFSGLDASCLELEDAGASKRTKVSRKSAPFPITKKYLQRLILESAKKMFDIFDDNIKVGAGTSEVRLQFKLSTGYVTVNQLAESATYKKTGKFISTLSGNAITNTLHFAYPEEVTEIPNDSSYGFKRPGYIASSSGLSDKAMGNFLSNCLKNPSTKTFQLEISKFFKTQFVAIGIAAAGHYYYTSGYQAPDYATDEFHLASHMAAGGAFAHFAGTIFCDLADYYLRSLLNHPLMTPQGFYEAALAQEKRLKKAAYKTQKIITDTHADLIESIMPEAHIPKGMTRTDSLKLAAYNTTLQVAYEFGSYLGDTLHTFNTFGQLTNPKNNNERQEARAYFGSIAAYFSHTMMNGCGMLLSNLAL